MHYTHEMMDGEEEHRYSCWAFLRRLFRGDPQGRVFVKYWSLRIRFVQRLTQGQQRRLSFLLDEWGTIVGQDGIYTITEKWPDESYIYNLQVIESYQVVASIQAVPLDIRRGCKSARGNAQDAVWWECPYEVTPPYTRAPKDHRHLSLNYWQHLADRVKQASEDRCTSTQSQS